MYITPALSGKYRENKPRQSEAEVSCFALKRLIFKNDRCSIHYTAYYIATCQNEKITSHGVSFYNLLISREIVCQIRWQIQPNALGLTNYRTICGVIWKTWKKTLSLTAVITCLATVNYQKIIDRRKLGRPMQMNGAFHSIKKSREIKHRLEWGRGVGREKYTKQVKWNQTCSQMERRREGAQD